MIVETKFNIGQDAWMMYENKPHLFHVCSMELALKKNDNPNVYCSIDDDVNKIYYKHIHENNLFHTKKELCDYLLNND